LPILSLALVDWFSLPGVSEPGREQFAQRYFSIEQYRSGNRLQLDSRMSALLGAKEDYKKRGVHIAYQQTLWRCVANAGLGR
jgi:hypothetical protein